MAHELKPEQTELIELTQADRELALINEKHDGQVFDMTTTLGRASIVAARADYRKFWVDLGKTSKTLKAHLNNVKKHIDTKTGELTEQAKAKAEPFDKKIKEYEAEVEARKETERLRKKGIQDVIHALRETVGLFNGKDSAEIKDGITKLAAYEVDDSFMEFKEQAGNALELALVDMASLLDSTLKTEQADAARKEESERLTKQKAEQDEREAKLLAKEEEAALETVAKDMEKEPEPTAMRKDIETAKEVLTGSAEPAKSVLCEARFLPEEYDDAPLSGKLQGIIDIAKSHGATVANIELSVLEILVTMALEVEAKEGGS